MDAVRALAVQRGFAVEANEDPAVFTPERLSQFPIIVFLNATTDPKDAASEWLSGSRRDALQQFVRAGGGVLAIHAAADSH